MPDPLTTSSKQISEALSRRGRRITDVIARVEAQSFVVTTAGHLVALHCATAAGVVVVTGPLDAFVATARARRDANGRYFPAPTAEAKAQGAGWQFGPVTPLPSAPPLVSGRKQPNRAMTPERQAKIDEAARRVIANPSLKAYQVAEEIGEPSNYLYRAITRQRAEARPPVAKPSGKLL